MKRLNPPGLNVMMKLYTKHKMNLKQGEVDPLIFYKDYIKTETKIRTNGKVIIVYGKRNDLYY